ncbi:MAG: HAMP domain-containing sensor histidine kinase [Lapillicoccus sp.]
MTTSTAFQFRAFPLVRAGLHPRRLISGALFAPWLATAALCTALMWYLPGNETIPYHIAWTTFALAFGSRVWSNRRTLIGLCLFTVVTGGILLMRVSQGVLAWQETAEIPLMSLIMMLLVWNVRRRQDALSTLTELAGRESARAREEEFLTRLTSHELRTPLTIAAGYVDLLRDREVDPQKVEDLDIVRSELVRLSRTSERLIWVMRLQSEPARELVDVDMVLDEAVSRWSRVTPRDWVVDSCGGTVLASPERLRVCLDTLVENAIRYTTTSDTVRVFITHGVGGLRIGVADSGPGIPEEQAALINRLGDRDGVTDPLTQDSRSLSGLGLGIVKSIAVARGGRLVVARAPEGGALVAMEVPFELSPTGRSHAAT